MPGTAHAEFELILGSMSRIASCGGRELFVQALTPAGVADGWLRLPRDKEFDALRSAAADVGPGAESREQLGRRLFEALFAGGIREVWDRTLGQQDRDNAIDRVRVRLWFADTVADAAALPWELLADKTLLLAADGRLTLSRYLPGPEPMYLPPQPQLRVLLVVASPTQGGNLKPIPEAEADALKQAIASVAEVRPLHNPDIGEIAAALQEKGGEPHVLHFLGHGEPDKLYLVRPDGRPDGREVADLGRLVVGRRSLRLVVLSACGSAQAPGGGLFSGVGPTLVRFGLPAVVAMQYPAVLNDTAATFNAAFYAALKAGHPVDVAVSEGRQKLTAAGRREYRDWSTPVLYLGTRGGAPLDFAGRRPDSATEALRRVGLESESMRAVVAALRRSVADLADRFAALDRALDRQAHVRALREAVDRCETVVAPARNKLRTLDPNELTALHQEWEKARAIGLETLRRSADPADTPGWLRELLDTGDQLSADLERKRRMSPLERLVTLTGALAAAERALREAVETTTRQSVVAGRAALGELAAPAADPVTGGA